MDLSDPTGMACPWSHRGSASYPHTPTSKLEQDETMAAAAVLLGVIGGPVAAEFIGGGGAAATTTATVTTANLSQATISVTGDVATVNIQYAAAPLSQLAGAASDQAVSMGASTAVVNTGIVADEGLADSLAGRAASGEGFMGGTVESTGDESAPKFTITIPLK